MHTLLILDDDASRYRDLLKEIDLPDLHIHAVTDDKMAAPFLATAELILGRPDLVAAVLDRCPLLRWVQSTFAGIEPLMVPGLRTDYLLTGVKDVFGPLISEYVLGYIISRERKFLAIHQQQEHHTWERLPYRSLSGLTLGIAGLGSIGAHVAKTAGAFGMQVMGLTASGAPVDEVDQVFTILQKNQFLPHLDYLLLALPDTPETRHFIGPEEIQLMKKEAVLINIGRGSAVDLNALAESMNTGTIGGAILDVFPEEPLPPESPLWDLPGMVVTPHCAAFSFPEQIVKIFTRNYRLFHAGQPLAYSINFEKGY